jgi:hypothetical protein
MWRAKLGNAHVKHGTVVLVGQIEWPQFLYMGLALHRAGFQVVTVTDIDQPKELASWLRVITVGSLASAQFERALRELDAQADVRWILPLEEAAIEACHDALPDSPKLYPRIPLATRQLLEKKTAMGELATSVGVRAPQWMPVANAHDATTKAARMGFPLVLKGEAGHAGKTVVICQDQRELDDGLVRLAGQPLFLQTYIQGQNWGCGAFFVEGKACTMQAYEILDQLPAVTGPAARLRIAYPEELCEGLQRMGAALKWNGFLQADYMRTADGQFYFLELNPRAWGSMTAGGPGSMNSFKPLTQALQGQTVDVQPRIAAGWVGDTFPKPALSHADMGHALACLGTALRPSFWLSAPTWDLSVMRFFAKLSFWKWRNRQARAVATKSRGAKAH